MSEKVAEISDPTHNTSLMTSLRQFVNTESFVDLQFICQGGHKVFAHKLMLISVSGLLKKLLTENPANNEMITIHLPDVNSKLLRLVVNFLYIGFMRLNDIEMKQFKLVLGLLDIELFQKNSEGGTSTIQTLDNKYTSNMKATELPVKPCGPPPSASGVYRQQPLPTGFAQVSEEASRITSLPVENRMQQYITIQTNQLAPSRNPGEVLIPLSAVPIISSGSNMVVSGSIQNLSTGPQPVVSGENQYNLFTNNIVNGSLMTNHTNNTTTMQSPLVSNCVQQLTPQQSSIQQNLVQQQMPQHMVQYQESKSVSTSNSNNNVPFTNANPESSHSIIPVSHKSDRKRKSSHFPSSSSKKIEDVIDLSGDDGTECQTKPKIVNVHCSQKSFKTGKRKSSKSKHMTTTSSTNVSSNSSSSSNNNNNSKEVIEIDQ